MIYKMLFLLLISFFLSSCHVIGLKANDIYLKDNQKFNFFNFFSDNQKIKINPYFEAYYCQSVKKVGDEYEKLTISKIVNPQDCYSNRKIKSAYSNEDSLIISSDFLPADIKNSLNDIFEDHKDSIDFSDFKISITLFTIANKVYFIARIINFEKLKNIETIRDSLYPLAFYGKFDFYSDTNVINFRVYGAPPGGLMLDKWVKDKKGISKPYGRSNNRHIAKIGDSEIYGLKSGNEFAKPTRFPLTINEYLSDYHLIKSKYHLEQLIGATKSVRDLVLILRTSEAPPDPILESEPDPINPIPEPPKIPFMAKPEPEALQFNGYGVFSDSYMGQYE